MFQVTENSFSFSHHVHRLMVRQTLCCPSSYRPRSSLTGCFQTCFSSYLSPSDITDPPADAASSSHFAFGDERDGEAAAIPRRAVVIRSPASMSVLIQPYSPFFLRLDFPRVLSLLYGLGFRHWFYYLLWRVTAKRKRKRKRRVAGIRVVVVPEVTPPLFRAWILLSCLYSLGFTRWFLLLPVKGDGKKKADTEAISLWRFDRRRSPRAVRYISPPHISWPPHLLVWEFGVVSFHRTESRSHCWIFRKLGVRLIGCEMCEIWWIAPYRCGCLLLWDHVLIVQYDF